MKSLPAFALFFLAFCSGLTAADDTPSRIQLENVPLGDVIRNLAAQSGMNYIIDPRVPGSSFGPGSNAKQPLVTARWTNMPASKALHALLKDHQLILVTNPVTTVARIAPAAAGVKPVSPSELGTGTNSGPVLPRIGMEAVPITEAISKLAEAAGIKVTLDPAVTAPAFAGQGTVSFRFEQITARQALVALLDNYGLNLLHDAATSTGRVTLIPGKRERMRGTD